MRAMLRVPILAPLVFLAASVPTASALRAQRAADWPEFRGPGGDGVLEPAAVPVEWSEEKNVVWRTPLEGRAWSTPVVVDGRIWMSNATDDGAELSFVACDLATGERVAGRTLFEVPAPQPVNALNSHASPSPVAEPGRVWFHFGTYGTVCIDTESLETVWERTDLNCDHFQGAGSSPILWRDRIVFHVDGADVQYVVALDKATGETLWRTERSLPLEQWVPDLRKAYGTPIVVEVDGEPQLISAAAQGTYAYDPRTGKELWRVRHDGFSNSSRPVVGAGLVITNTGYNKPRLVAVRLGGSGDVTEERVVWEGRRNVPTMPSPVFVAGRLFQVADNGILSCLDPETGEQVWRERALGPTCASLLAVGERIYAFDREGETVVFRAADRYEELGRNRLEDGLMASPVVVDDALILRTRSALYRIETDG